MASGIKGFLGQADAGDILYHAVHEQAEGTYFEAEGTLPLNQKEKWIALIPVRKVKCFYQMTVHENNKRPIEFIPGRCTED